MSSDMISRYKSTHDTIRTNFFQKYFSLHFWIELLLGCPSSLLIAKLPVSADAFELLLLAAILFLFSSFDSFVRLFAVFCVCYSVEAAFGASECCYGAVNYWLPKEGRMSGLLF